MTRIGALTLAALHDTVRAIDLKLGYIWRPDVMVPTANERVAAVKFTNDALSVSLRDGRTIIVPLAWYPRLLDASPAQRKNWHVAGGGYGIHWPEIDEDLSTEGLLREAPAPPS